MTIDNEPLSMDRRRLILLAALAGLFTLLALSGLPQQLSLANLKAQQAELQAWVAAAPVVAALAYAAFYVLFTALALPGAQVLTLAGGLLFGIAWGLGLASLASTMGATLAFLGSRFLFRDSLHARCGAHLQAIEEGLRRDGLWYLLSLRLIAIVPFFLINLVMGLTPVRVRDYVWVSWAGMLPGTFLYVLAGTELGAITRASDILSARILLLFVALALFPLVLRLLMPQPAAAEPWKARQ